MEKIITRVPPSEFRSLAAHFLARVEKSMHPLYIYVRVRVFRFSPFRTRAAAPSPGAVHIFYFALDGLISLSSSRQLFMVPYIYIPALQLLFSALGPLRKYDRGKGRALGKKLESPRGFARR